MVGFFNPDLKGQNQTIRQDEFLGGGSLEGTIGRVQFSVVVVFLLPFPCRLSAKSYSQF